MLPSRVSIPPPPNPTPEDIFSASLGVLFTDDIQNAHGTPGQSVIYSSPRYGDIKLAVPRHPDVEEGRKLFAHYLWNAGVVAADAIECASNDDDAAVPGLGKVRWDRRYWDVQGQDVLELGAGTALPSLISALSAAKSTTITDHPSSPALVADTIAHNVRDNLHINLLPSQPVSPEAPPPRTSTQIAIHGLTWGDKTFMSPFVYGRPSSPQPSPNSFGKIIIADCLWMPSQHANIVKTIDQNLRLQPQLQSSEDARQACALVIAGFHTGRRIVARFFEIATGSRSGVADGRGISPQDGDGDEESEEVMQVKGTLRAAQIFEVDVDCNVRSWQAERDGENKDAAKRWVVCAALVRR